MQKDVRFFEMDSKPPEHFGDTIFVAIGLYVVCDFKSGVCLFVCLLFFSHGAVVRQAASRELSKHSTLDFDSKNPSSNLGERIVFRGVVGLWWATLSKYTYEHVPYGYRRVGNEHVPNEGW